METIFSKSAGTKKLPDKEDREGYNKLFQFYYPRLVAYGELFLDKPSAEDIVQDLMVYVWQNSGNLSIHTSLEAYLFKSVYLRSLNRIRDLKVRSATTAKKALDRFMDSESIHYDPDRNEIIRKIFSAELRKEIDDAIAGLPPKCREAFIESYINDRKTSEIAGLLSISERTVETHVYTALKQLRKKLKDNMYLIIPLYLGI